MNNEIKIYGWKAPFLKNHYTVLYCAAGDKKPHEKLNVKKQCSDRVLGRRPSEHELEVHLHTTCSELLKKNSSGQLFPTHWPNY